MEYRMVKIGFDITVLLLGTVLGEKLGEMTIITALAAGPVIRFFSGTIKNII